jgi:hypothetical protein
MHDSNAMMFPQPTQYNPYAQQAMGNANMAGAAAASATGAPIEVSSELSLAGLTAQWAVQNREALTQTLRTTLMLQPSEKLVITGISQARRLTTEERELQTGTGVRIAFTVGLSSPQRAQQSQAGVQQLSAGNIQMLSNLVQTLDMELQRRGSQPVRLSPASVAVAAPRVTSAQQQASTGMGGFGQSQTMWTVDQGVVGQNSNQAAPANKKKDSDNDMLMGALILAIAVVFYALYTGKKTAQAAPAAAAGRGGQQQQSSSYNAKIAVDDELGFDELR